ncbi:putative P protein [Cytorhabdovirus fragariarugosus]|uniref:Putative P protein n=1 Tax=Cytorhabdovirus fragariarugosus TaxID=1985706 RepID=A0A2U8J9D8_9RHAB|nr:putative P protein [Cytorhabdovirus fragariarugosus]AWK49428.1 putative P protein [Cytorhabdovirus fragariarugosus]
MADLDFGDLPNPKLDINMSNVGEDDFEDDMVDDLNDNSIGSDDDELPDLDELQEEDGDNNVNGYDGHEPYHPRAKEDLIADLKVICDTEGVSYTIPMENQILKGLNDESVSHNCLYWYVKGIIVANQTQIIPTISGAMSELKMETKFLQTAAGKINKEVKKSEDLMTSISKELKSVKEDMQMSFRSSMERFMKEVRDELKTAGCKTDNGEAKNEIRSLVKNDKINADYEEGDSVIATVVIPKCVPSTSSSKYHVEKRQWIQKMGIEHSFVKELDDDLIDQIYPDALHKKVQGMKLTAKNKDIIKKLIMKKIDECMSGSDSDSDDDSETE